ncbi:MAG: Ig-like domain-containing protein [Bacteroidales bacterium]
MDYCMKKICLLNLTLCLAAGVPALADETININNPSAAGGTGWSFDTAVVTISANGNYTVTGTSTANRIVINKNVTATVTLQNANIHSAVASPFMLSSDTVAGGKGSQITLILSGTNELVSTYVESPGLQVEDSARLIIQGAGSLTAQGGDLLPRNGGGAGIGGGDMKSCGNITITGGTITATGGIMAAGIGGGPHGNGGNITITGGTIVAVAGGSSGDPAGIGGGGWGNAGTVTVTGGTVYASAGGPGPGIGGGIRATEGVINITGGTVVANEIGIGNGRTETNISGANTLVLSQSINTTTFGGATVLTGDSVEVSAYINIGDNVADVTLHADLTIPAGCTLTVPAGIVFDVNHKRLTVNGELVRQGQVINEDYIPPAPPVRDINLSDIGKVDGDGWVFRSNVVTITESGDRTITGSSDAVSVVIEKDVTAVITLDNVRIHSAVASPFALSSDTIAGGKGSQVTLILSGTNELVTTNGGSAGLTVTDSARITIQGSGSLFAQGAGYNPYGGAGIGGGGYSSTGTINITGGTVYASGGLVGAGIGGGTNGGGGNITITGGTITAIGGSFAAGIGGGQGGSGGNITVTGGIITATGDGGAGIGGGRSGEGGSINVTGGTITATGGTMAAAIGGGHYGNGGNITVTGGTITATGGVQGVGIGGGVHGNGGRITISGGVVVAVSPGGEGDPPGIGGGAFSAGAGTVNITGGTVYASAGGSAPGIGSGAGATGGVINITGGTVIADEIGMGNTRTETNISGANTIALSPSINATTFGGAQVLTGNNVNVSSAITAGDAVADVTLHGDLTVPGGSTLIVPAGIVFDVNHKGLVNNGIIREYGSMINRGNLTGNQPVGPIQTNWIADIPPQNYTGDSIKPAVTVSYGTLTLAHGVHYSVAYTNNVKAGTATVTVTDLGDNSMVTKTFLIIKQPFAADWIEDIPAQTYTGDSIKPAVTVKDGSKTLTLNTDYIVAYTNNVDAGAATVTVTGIGVYTGSASKTFIIAKPFAAGWIDSIPPQTWTGDSVKPAVTVRDGSKTLTLNTDYTVVYDNNVDAGVAVVTVTGMGSYSYAGSATKTFIITKQVVAGWLEDIPPQTYTGDSIKPPVVVKDGDKTLIPGTDYIVAYNNNVNAGAAAVVTVTGMGSYSYAGSASKTFVIAPKPLAAGWLGNIPDPTYTGEPAKPAFTVKDGSKVLTEGRDYTVTCDNNVNAGTAVATVTGMGNYTGAVSKTFTVLPQAITAEWVEDIPLQTHTGEAIKPAVVVTDGRKVLTEGRDYSVWYSNNTGAGTATATITAEGNYSGTVHKPFVIAPGQVAAGWWIEVLADLTYTGEALMPAITVSDAARTLIPGTDYTAAEYSNNVNAGAATVMVTGRGNYSGTAIQTFTILPKAMDAEWVENIPAQTYTGEPAKPALTVKDGGKALTADLHYAFTYRDNVNAGTATAIVRGRGNYAGQVEKTFAIAPKLIADDWLEPVPNQTYTGKAIKPSLTVVDGSRTLKPNTDYAAIAYSNNTDAGTATVMIEGLGNYGGTAGKTFTIHPKTITKEMVWATGDRLYTGSAIEPLMIVDQLGSGVLKKGTDYEIVYADNTEEGTASYTVTGKGNYDGTVSGTFGIVRSRKPIPDSWVQPIAEQPYTGSAVEPYVVVTGLAFGRDYTVYYCNNIEPGTATAVVTGTGDYAGTVSRAFTISPKRGIAESWIAYIAPQTYTGDSIKPAFTVGNGAVILTPGTDYTVEYSNNVNAGTARATVTGAGIYTGTANRAFVIERQPLPVSAIETIEDRVYTGGALEPSVAVTGLVAGVDYAVEYSDNIHAGRATAAVTGKGNYAGTVYAYFTIRPKPVAGGWIGNIPAQTYTGDSLTPAVTVTDGTATLVAGTDYTISYADNLNAGTATVTITGKGNYGGTATGTFVIDRLALRSSWVLLIPDQPYTGSAVKPPVTVIGLAQDVDYTVSWSDNVDAGMATVTISGVGNYTGEVRRSFRIIATGTEEAASAHLRITPADNGIIISGLTPGKNISIYTLQGQLLYESKASSPEETIYLQDKGVYILRHKGKTCKFSW